MKEIRKDGVGADWQARDVFLWTCCWREFPKLRSLNEFIKATLSQECTPLSHLYPWCRFAANNRNDFMGTHKGLSRRFYAVIPPHLYLSFSPWSAVMDSLHRSFSTRRTLASTTSFTSPWRRRMRRGRGSERESGRWRWSGRQAGIHPERGAGSASREVGHPFAVSRTDLSLSFFFFPSSHCEASPHLRDPSLTRFRRSLREKKIARWRT